MAEDLSFVKFPSSAIVPAAYHDAVELKSIGFNAPASDRVKIEEVS